MKEKLPRHFQRVTATGKLRICLKVPDACRPNLPGDFKDKAYLIHHLSTSDLKQAERKEREIGVIDKFTRLIEAARPTPTKWAYIPPTAWEIERMRIMLEGFMKLDPDTAPKTGPRREVYDAIKENGAVLEGRFVQMPVTQTSHGYFQRGYRSLGR